MKDAQETVTRQRSARPKPTRQRTAKGGYKHLATDKPRRKPTKLEVWERLDFVAHLLAQGVGTHAIKRQFRAQFGDLSESCARQYLASARERLVRESNQPREAHITEALAFCKAMRSDQNVAPRDRLKAQELLNELLGLNAPKEFNMHGDPLLPLITIVVANRDELRDIYAAHEIDGVNVRLTNGRLLEDERLNHGSNGPISEDVLEAEFQRITGAETSTEPIDSVAEPATAEAAPLDDGDDS